MRVKLWIKNAATYAFAGILGAAVYSLMMFLMDPAYDMGNLLDMASGYLLGIGVVMAIVVGMMDYKTTLPLALSFGSTRKQALVGMQLGRLVYMVIYAVVVIGFFAVTNGWDVLIVVAPVTIGAMLLMSAIGAVFGILNVKFGKVVAVVSGILIGLFAACCGFAAVFFLVTTDEMSFKLSEWVFWLLPVAAAAIYGLVLIPECKTVYKYNVKL